MDTRSPADVLLFDGFCLDRRGGVLSRLNEAGVFVPVGIGSRALEVLGVLIDRPGDLVAKDAITGAVWPRMVVSDNNLAVHISTLRRILDRDRDDVAVAARLHIGRIQPDIGPFALQGPIEKDCDLAVDLAAQP
jgi:DNA-binding winged helix-turn-helix (wHTH) protein